MADHRAGRGANAEIRGLGPGPSPRGAAENRLNRPGGLRDFSTLKRGVLLKFTIFLIKIFLINFYKSILSNTLLCLFFSYFYINYQFRETNKDYRQRTIKRNKSILSKQRVFSGKED